MSLPINVKFEVPKCKAPPPTKTSLWPSLKAPPAGGEKVEAGKPGRPITTETQFKARDGRPLRGGLFQGRKSLMRFAIPAIPVLGLAMLLGLGCSNEKPKQPTSALDVGSNTATATPAPAPRQQPPATIAQPSAPTRTKPVAKAPAAAPVETVDADPAAPAKAGSQSYTVQKGDTLFGIAKSQYGDGNKWKKIADANPGLSPSSLKVGQKLVIPAI